MKATGRFGDRPHAVRKEYVCMLELPSSALGQLVPALAVVAGVAGPLLVVLLQHKLNKKKRRKPKKTRKAP